MAKYLEPQAKKALDGEKLRDEGKKWLARIEAAGEREKGWLEDAAIAEAVYTGEGGSGTANVKYDFNMLYANVETIVPAVINSPPQPDIRGRFGDDDKVARDVADVIDRTIRVQVDDSKLQIELEGGAQTAFLAGRGVVRLRFMADIGGEVDNEELHDLAEYFIDADGEELADGDDGEAGRNGGTEPDSVGAGADQAQPVLADQQVRNERIGFEAVSWRDYRHGPAKRWEHRPWEAYRHSIPLDQRDEFADGTLWAAQAKPEDDLGTDPASDDDVVFWEVWDRKTRKVKFVEEGSGKILKIVTDPLGLKCFYPCCTPMQPIEVTGRLKPVNPFSIYRKLADELDTTTKRIAIITKQMKVKGWYPGDAGDLAAMLDADDSQFVPIENAEIWAANGGLAGAVAFWPIEKFIQVLRELYANREQTKQAIYEITGISDIVRGASKATETLGAQQIKSQWGSLRIQKMQRMLERAARDLFVMMAEIIPAKFTAQTLQDITGIQLVLTQQDMMPVPRPNVHNMDEQMAAQAMQQWQQAEQARQAKVQHIQAVNALLNDGLKSAYRVDVESDSTVRADLTQKKQEQAEFLQGTAAYFQAVAPMVESGTMTREGALEIYAATARLFTLGRSTEEALDREIAEAKKRAAEPKQEAPDPAMVKIELETKRAEALAQIEASRARISEATAQAQIAKLNAATEAQKIDAQLKTVETNTKLEMDRRSHALDMQKGARELRKLDAEIAKINAGTRQTEAKTQADVVGALADPVVTV